MLSDDLGLSVPTLLAMPADEVKELLAVADADREYAESKAKG
jgi:hypothetical protein